MCGAIAKMSSQYEQEPVPATPFPPISWRGPVLGLGLRAPLARSIAHILSRTAVPLVCKGSLSLPAPNLAGIVTSTISRMRGQNTSLLESCMAGFGHDTILELPDSVEETRWLSTKVSAHGRCTKHEQGAATSGRW